LQFDVAGIALQHSNGAANSGRMLVCIETFAAPQRV
jgi:hypothetical protein